MTHRRSAALLAGVVAVAGLLVGCTSDGSGLPPQAATPEATTPPAGYAEQSGTLPADTVEAGNDAQGAASGQETPPPVSSEDSPSTSTAGPVTGPARGPYEPRTGDGVDVIYFETSNPCRCMTAVGDAVEDAVLVNFQDELSSGDLRFFFMVSNDPDNIDVVRTFNCQPFDLYVVEYRGGQELAEPVTELWSLAGDDEAIEELVLAKVSASLEAQR